MRKETLSSRSSVLSKLVSVIHVWIVVFGDHHPVGKLAASESLHGFLTVCSGDVLHKDLKKKKKEKQVSWVVDGVKIRDQRFLTFVQSRCFCNETWCFETLSCLIFLFKQLLHPLHSAIVHPIVMGSLLPLEARVQKTPWCVFSSRRELRFYSVFSPDDHQGAAVSSFCTQHIKT